MSAKAGAALTGRSLDGRYRIEALVGEGGTVTVYRATDELLGRPVAVKVLSPHLAGDAHVVARFEAEASEAASSHRSDLATVFDVGVDGDIHFVVTEHRDAAETDAASDRAVDESGQETRPGVAVTAPEPTVATPTAATPMPRPTPQLTRSRRGTTLPLGLRLVGIYFLLLAATLLVVGGVTVRLTRQHLTRELENRLSAAVASFQSGPAARVTRPEDLTNEARTWLAAQALPADEVVAIRTPAGEILTSTGGIDLRRVDQSRDLLTADQAGWWNVDGPRGSVRALTVPLELNSHPAGTIVAAGEQSPIERTLDTLLSSVAWASGIGLLLATVLALVAVRRTLRPLARMSRDVDAVDASGDLSRRVDDDGPRDEVGRLAESFNRMLATLEEAFRSQRRFLSDASHELRTPLTVARGQLELLAQELQSTDARGSLAVAVDEIDRMGRIVENLLLLARLDEGLPLAREAVEVELVLNEALLRATLVARRDVSVHVEPELYVLADPERLLQVVTNLVMNAVEHGDDGVAIRLSARRDADRGVIEVSDTGPGIQAEDLPHVFERFYRGTKTDETLGGAGLGLAIAASLTRAMGGEIDVRSTPGSGTTFVVSMPVAPTNA